ncbi:hypothetical protein WJ95_20250 [Burkholderia ubonensis]|nr:hypothetical protein WJ95_20250 [Burkholderia ubonensis]
MRFLPLPYILFRRKPYHRVLEGRFVARLLRGGEKGAGTIPQLRLDRACKTGVCKLIDHLLKKFADLVRTGLRDCRAGQPADARRPLITNVGPASGIGMPFFKCRQLASLHCRTIGDRPVRMGGENFVQFFRELVLAVIAGLVCCAADHLAFADRQHVVIRHG